MIRTEQIDILLTTGGAVMGSDGSKIGRVGQVFLDDVTGEPEWVTVHTGLFGTKESFVPLAQAELSDDNLSVSFTKDEVKDAPRISADQGHLSEEEEEALYRHYGLDYTKSRSGQVGYDTSGPSTDDAMTRSEEQLRVGTERTAAGRARLRKYVVTENVTQTVPVSREEVRLEREPITDANRGDALSGPGLSEEEHEVVLTEERPVVQKETVPVERVRLDTDTVTGEEQVDESLRKERVDLDADDVRGRDAER